MLRRIAEVFAFGAAMGAAATMWSLWLFPANMFPFLLIPRTAGAVGLLLFCLLIYAAWVWPPKAHPKKLLFIVEVTSGVGRHTWFLLAFAIGVFATLLIAE